MRTIQPTDGTVELVQTLKVLGYRIAIASRGFSFFTDALRASLGIDHTFGVALDVDEDSRGLVGTISNDAFAMVDRRRVIAQLMSHEHVAEADITVISDIGLAETPGIRLDFDMATILSHHKRHILSNDALMGLMGSFGHIRRQSS